jgi:hypothetical protein
MNTPEPLIPSTFLFHFSIPLLEKSRLFKGNLGAEYELPPLPGLSGTPQFCSVRGAWSRQGIRFEFHVTGRGAPIPDYHESAEDAEGVWLWIDTRATHNVHRATRFCHQFRILIHGIGEGTVGPDIQRPPIYRSREQSSAADPECYSANIRRTAGRYIVDVHLPAECMVGFDVSEHRQLGFFYSVRDSELGWNYWTDARQLPFTDDPSIWSTLEME